MRLFPIVTLSIASLIVACSDDDTTPAPGGGTTTPGATAGALETAVAACPAQTSLIQTTDWTSCLSGKTLRGTEVFGNQPCALRFETDGALSYLRADAVAIATPPRAQWKSASGSYQNDGSGARRLFLAGISPSLEVVADQPRVTDINVKVAGAQSGIDSTVEIAYLDRALARQTYNCKLSP